MNGSKSGSQASTGLAPDNSINPNARFAHAGYAGRFAKQMPPTSVLLTCVPRDCKRISKAGKGWSWAGRLTVFDGRNSAHTKTMHALTFYLYPGNCRVWDLDDPAYADEYACPWQAASPEAMDRAL